VEFADQVAAFLVGVFRDRTAVDDAYVGLGVGCDAHETAALELPREGRAFRKVEFAAEGMEIYSALLHKLSLFTGRNYENFAKREGFSEKKA